MKTKFKQFLVLAMVLSMVLGLAACGGATPATNSPAAATASAKPASTKSDLIVALPGEPATLDPYAHSIYSAFIPATLIFNTLIAKDDSGKYVPQLATEWTNQDDTTFVFKLRKGVTFHNGNTFTAEDVKFTLALAAKSSFSSNLFGCIDTQKTEVVDDYTIKVKLLYAYAPFMDTLASFRAGIIDKETYEKVGANAFGRNPIGTGPMQISNWKSGDRIELTANKSYWGSPLAYSTCVFRVIVEASSRTIELETGGVDIAVELPFSDWTRVSNNKDLQLISGQTNMLASLVFNNSLDMFKDVRVRQALAYGLDMKSLVDTVWEGTADMADSYYAKSLLGYKKEGPMEYNVEKAKALLAEAGYPNGMTITYTTYETALNQSFAEVLQSMWRKIGVTLNVVIVDLATFTSMNNSAKLTASLMTPAVAIGDPTAALVLWPTNRTISLRHNDKHIQDLLDQGASTYDTTKRAAIYGELQDYLYKMTYTVPIVYPKFAFGARKNIDKFVFTPSQVPDLTRITFK